MAGGGWRVAGGGWRVAGDGWRVTGVFETLENLFISALIPIITKCTCASLGTVNLRIEKLFPL